MSEYIDHHYETIYGYKVRDLIKIAILLEREELSPSDVHRALTDIDLVVDACRKEFLESLRIVVKGEDDAEIH